MYLDKYHFLNFLEIKSYIYVIISRIFNIIKIIISKTAGNDPFNIISLIILLF